MDYQFTACGCQPLITKEDDVLMSPLAWFQEYCKTLPPAMVWLLTGVFERTAGPDH